MAAQQFIARRQAATGPGHAPPDTHGPGLGPLSPSAGLRDAAATVAPLTGDPGTCPPPVPAQRARPLTRGAAGPYAVLGLFGLAAPVDVCLQHRAMARHAVNHTLGYADGQLS
ncbi:hypothetical protein DNK59_31510, partial [Pseudomonas sp. TKO26]